MNQQTNTNSTTPGITATQWENVTRRVDILTTLMTGILRMLTGNPAISAMAGSEFVDECNAMIVELDRLQTQAGGPPQLTVNSHE